MKLLHMISVILLVAGTATAAESRLKSGVFDPARQAPDFTLPGSHGKDFTLSDYRGKVMVLGFGFSHCPQICPTTLITLTATVEQLGDLADKIQVVFMTVDPERDTTGQLREYLSYFHPDFIGLTGQPERLAEVRQDYGIMTEKEAHGEGHYEVHHSSYLYLVDRRGMLRTLVPFGTSADDIAHDIRILLREEPRPETP